MPMENVNRTGMVRVELRRWNPETHNYGDWELIDENHNLLCTNGRDVLHAQAYGTTAGTYTARYIALTTDSGAPNASDTQLTSEIALGGLSRVLGLYAHTASNATCTVVNTFTASAQFTAVQKSGLFNAVSGVTMIHENTFSSTNLNTNDQLVVTWTVTIS